MLAKPGSAIDQHKPVLTALLTEKEITVVAADQTPTGGLLLFKTRDGSVLTLNSVATGTRSWLDI